MLIEDCCDALGSSFGGRLAIGLNADGDAIPELMDLAEGVERSLVELTGSVGAVG